MLKKLVRYIPESQAHVFFLLFGPSCADGQSHHDNQPGLWEGFRLIMNDLDNHADWDAFVDNSADDFHEGKEMFYTLAQAVCSCMTAVRPWKEECLVPVLDHLFCIPRPWKRENVAGFLLFCSEKVMMGDRPPEQQSTTMFPWAYLPSPEMEQYFPSPEIEQYFPNSPYS